MKYSGQIDIDKPLEIVTSFFADSKNLKKWQDGFQKKELLSGKELEDGTVSKMYYQYGDKDMTLIETIISNQLPNSFEATYQHKHMDNTMKCTFTAIGKNKTRYAYEYEYTRMSWIMPRLMAILFPGMYRKQGEKWMQQLKTSVENQ
ncbi:MAG: SRPBCC family protein [Bacteroidota bacterium]